MLDVYDLMKIAERSNPPDHDNGDECVVTLDAGDGWKAAFFYDVGDLDYLEFVIDPEGIKINPWDKSTLPEKYAYLSDTITRMQGWVGIGDADRLRGVDWDN